MDQPIETRARFDLIRYANCWEDADILVDALQPGPGKTILSIGSAGDNALALLAAGARVVAADLSQSQLACVEIRRAAFAHLSYGQLLAFLGVQPCAQRRRTYQRLRDSVPDFCREFWDQRPAAIENGIIHDGKFENYFQKFRQQVLPWIHKPKKIERWLQPQTKPQRVEFYDRHWNNWRWRSLFKVFFSRWVMGKLGRDPEFFRYVEGSIGNRLLERTRSALTELTTHDNPYLVYILTGNYSEQALPRYLREEYFEPIRIGLSRLTVVQGPIDRVAQSYVDDEGFRFDGYNLSDIFEYMSPELTAEVYGRLLATANSGARLVYWNMMVPRTVPSAYSDQIESCQSLAESLFGQDKACFYNRFVVEQVK